MKSRKIALVLLVSILLVILAGCFKKSGGSAAANLTFYGLDDSDAFEQIIAQYRENHSNVQIRYKKFVDPYEYENLIVNEIAEGEGPDIFFVHNTWLPRHTKKLVPFTPTDTLNNKIFSDTFVKVAADDFVQPDPSDGLKKIYALPLYVDTLALYYNKEDFERKLPERGKPANTWELVKAEADKFRQQPENGKLEKGAIALGRADNIRLASDILYNLFLQSGVDFYDKEFKQAQFSNQGQETFDFYESFGVPQNKNYSWDGEIIPAHRELGEVEAFLAGKVSAMVGYSDLYPRLETELKNVKSRNSSVISASDVAVAPIPQVATDESDYKVWANYYGLGVSRNSKSPNAAWDFAQFVASKSAAKIYHQRTKRPTARRDLIEDQKKEPITDVFVSQVGYAGSFRIYSDQRFSQYLQEAIQAAAGGQSSRSALAQAQTKINDLLKLEAPEGLYPKPKKKK